MFVGACPIDKILGKEFKAVNGDSEEDGERVVKYLVKWKDRSYLHTSWEDEDTLLGHGGKQRLLNFERKWYELKFEIDDRVGSYRLCLSLSPAPSLSYSPFLSSLTPPEFCCLLRVRPSMLVRLSPACAAHTWWCLLASAVHFHLGL